MASHLTRVLLVVVAAVAFLLTATGAFAYSGFPSNDYPYNQYGMGARYYSGPWGERMVYGGHGYFPNWNGQAPYGYRTYGYMYTPQDLRQGTTMRSYGGFGNGGGYGAYGGSYNSYGYGVNSYSGRYVTAY